MEEQEQPPKKSGLDSCLLAFAAIFLGGIIVVLLWLENLKQQIGAGGGL